MRIHTPVMIVLIACLAASGCSSKRSQTLQLTRTGEEWVCQPNEQADGWQCVQDDELADVIARERSLPAGTLLPADTSSPADTSPPTDPSPR